MCLDPNLETLKLRRFRVLALWGTMRVILNLVHTLEKDYR